MKSQKQKTNVSLEKKDNFKKRGRPVIKKLKNSFSRAFMIDGETSSEISQLIVKIYEKTGIELSKSGLISLCLFLYKKDENLKIKSIPFEIAKMNNDYQILIELKESDYSLLNKIKLSLKKEHTFKIKYGSIFRLLFNIIKNDSVEEILNNYILMFSKNIKIKV